MPNPPLCQIGLAKYISAISLNLMSFLLPYLIYFIEMFTPHIAKSEKIHKVMKSLYLYLIMMVVIFPSLGLMS